MGLRVSSTHKHPYDPSAKETRSSLRERMSEPKLLWDPAKYTSESEKATIRAMGASPYREFFKQLVRGNIEHVGDFPGGFPVNA